VASVAVAATARQAAARIAVEGGRQPGTPPVTPADVREARRRQPTASLIVLAVDASGSMGAPERMEAAKGAVLGLLGEAYRRRDVVGLVAFRGERAEVLLRPTGSIEVARARLARLPTGGRTPLAAGIAAGLELATAPTRIATHRPLLVLVTDGRATAGPAGGDPVAAAEATADAVRRAGIEAVVVDVEPAGSTPGWVQLGLARRLATRMGARYVPLASVDTPGLRGAIGIG
jgi:magnesium chelatase subunit D